MKFIHSADWQIGKVFKQFGAKENTLRQARLDAVEWLGELAIAHEVRHVLVAGDVYDNEAPSPVTLPTSEEDNEAGQFDEAEEVAGVILPADEDATLPLYPCERRRYATAAKGFRR